MYQLFYGKSTFNDDISNMNELFFESTFNDDKSKWDTSKVTDMGYMLPGVSIQSSHGKLEYESGDKHGLHVLPGVSVQSSRGKLEYESGYKHA